MRLVLLNLKLLLKGMGFWLRLLIVMVSQYLRIHGSKFDYDLGPSSIGTLGMGMGSTDLKVQRITSPSHGKKVLLLPDTVVSLENIIGRLEEFQDVAHWVNLTGQVQSCEPVYFGILLPPTFGKWQQLSNSDIGVLGQAQVELEKDWSVEESSYVLKLLGQT